MILQAYRHGIFPMAIDETGRIGWFSPDPRGILPLDDRFHVGHGLRRRLRRNPFVVTVNRAFGEVMAGCAACHGSTWISAEIIRAYGELHLQGHAHSVEAWMENRLAGGLYGVQLGGAFFGESMFHRVTDASKVALVALVERLRSRGFQLLDVQWVTRHLQQFGAYTIPREEYLQRLAEALRVPARFDP